MSGVLVMSYVVHCEFRAPIPEIRMAGNDVLIRDPQAASRSVADLVRQHLAGVPNVDPSTVAFRVEERP